MDAQISFVVNTSEKIQFLKVRNNWLKFCYNTLK